MEGGSGGARHRVVQLCLCEHEDDVGDLQGMLVDLTTLFLIGWEIC